MRGGRGGQHNDLLISLLLVELLHVRPGRVNLRHLLLAVYALLFHI